MNILLVNPQIPYKFRMFEYADEEGRKAISKRTLVGPPLALNELAAMFPNENVVILDQKAELDADHSYDHIEGLSKEINDFKPDIVAFTCLTAQYNSVLKSLEIVKQINNKILIVMGGIHVTACPEGFIGSKVDILTVGHGKSSFYQIVQEFKKNRENADYSKIPGLAINRGNSLYYTKSLSEISYKEFKENYLFDTVIPDRSLTDKYKYIIPQMKKEITYLSTSQGCTHKCNFCYIWQMLNGRYYSRSVDSVIEEIKLLDKYPIIRFCDAHTFGNIHAARELFTRIIEEGLDEHYYVADVRTDTVIKHPELMQLAAKAGLKVTICGLEATSDEELKKYGKDNSIENTKIALKILNEAGINVNGNYIVRPDYDEKDFERMGRFVEENPIYHSGFTILTPFPGTEQWEQLKDEIVITDFDYYNLTNAVTKTKLSERDFYAKLTELYKTSGKATQKFFSIYGNSLGL
ncbi:MAG: B12-binding domain-containing radical SAM protein [Halanaerobiales bacterium]|nr:B12-binding domain-containing radical SAM protein [Halanaerobiales bacterium]